MPTKDGIQGEPWSQYTFHWDNVRFDGPVLPVRPAFGPGPHLLDLMHDPGPSNVQGVTITIPSGSVTTRCWWAMSTACCRTTMWIPEPRPLASVPDPWRGMAGPAAAEERALGHGDRGWSTFALPVSGIVAGDNRIEFRYPTRPPQATWQWDGFRVKDVEIQGDPDLAPLMEAVPSIQQTSAEAAEPNVTMPSDSPRIQEADPDQDP